MPDPKIQHPNNSSSSDSDICARVRELAPLYAIGALRPDEQRLMETMLPFCPEVAAELNDYLNLADSLMSTVPQNEAPPAITALMARVAAYEQQETLPEIHLQDPLPLMPLMPLMPLGTPLPAAAPARYWRALIASAAVLLLLLLAGSNLFWMYQVNVLRQDQQQLLTLLTNLQTPSIVGTNDHHRYLTATPVLTGDSNAILIWNSDQQIGTLYVSNLPPLSSDQAYQVWLMREDHHISLGTFEVDANGVGTLVFHSSEPVESFNLIGVSAEPSAGAEAPTTPHVLTGKI